MTTSLAPQVVPGDSPLLISVPHAGTGLPAALSRRLSKAARAVPDTDWFVDRLYAWAADAGAGLLVATASRYVVDLNRPPDDTPLYDPSETRLMTGVVPLQTFDGQAIYRPGETPGPEEVAARIREHWRPYHARLAAELGRIGARHGYALLLDAHSIRCEVPLLFEGRLPDLNLGSDGGASAAGPLLRCARRALACDDFSLVVDGRFRGGHITRHYGRPKTGVHALQLEIAQAAYMRENPARWNAARARPLQQRLRRLIESLLEWRPDEH